MMWEYCFVDLRSTVGTDQAMSALNDAGKEGWELVAVTEDPTNSDYMRYFFKRPLVVDVDKKSGG